MMMMKRKDMIIAGLLVLLVILLTSKMMSFGDALTPPDKGNIIIYGSKACGWCQKQEKYLIDNGLPYTFVDCKDGSCPDYVKGFPTLLVDNVIKVGYTEV
jgi:glutaredoxin